jgi:ATP synthase F1 gamma subunit
VSSLQEVAAQQAAMGTIVNLTGVFEGLASMKIGQTKNQVLESQKFFDVLWNIYSQIRVDQLFRFGRSQGEQPIDKELLIVITSEGAFSGDIDQRLIRFLMKDYDPRKHDIVVIGHHGAILLTQQEVRFSKYFTLPKKDNNINVAPLLREVRRYKTASVYYQTYISLMQQDMKRISLNSAVQAKGKQAGASKDVISELTYIFEPSSFEVVAHLERSMTEIALSQVILESKLAQYASRFRAMSVSNDRAVELTRDLTMEFHRTKRRIQDERLKEIINGLKASQ